MCTRIPTRHTLRPTFPPPYSLPTCAGPQPAHRSCAVPSRPHRHVSSSMLTCHGVRTPTPPPHATHSHATPLPLPLTSRLSPPLPPSAVYVPPPPPSTRRHRRRLRAATAAIYAPPLPPSTRQCHESRCGAFRKVPQFCCCESSGGRCLSQLIRSSFCPTSFYVDLSQDQGCAFAFCVI